MCVSRKIYPFFFLSRVVMERGFQFQRQLPLLCGGSGGGGESSYVSLDDAYLNNLCPGVSFRSLLTYNSSSGGPATENRNPLKMPKTEPLFASSYDGVSAPYKFISESAASSSSFELPQKQNPRVAETVSYVKQRGKRQPQKLSDKTRVLQKLIPWDGKTDMATVLEETYKYIKFLQAQVSVLQSMPRESGGGGWSDGRGSTTAGCLGRLNRQQLMQVVINSPVAQKKLYSKGCCVYSVEQLVWLKRIAERKAMHHRHGQMVLLDSSPSSNPNLSSLGNDV